MTGDSVQRIKERLSIVDVISPYVELHKAGKNMKGKSPFTSEKTPSFYVSPDRGMYYCFSSSQGGDMFTFVEKMEGVDFKGALKILAEKAGVELVPEDPKKRTERDTQYTILEEATRFFESELPKNKEAKKYLEDRGVKEETIKKWRIGYVPGPPKNGWRHTREYLSEKGFKDEALIRAGLVKIAGEGKQPYDVFRDRLMFPICDPSGRVVAFSGRILEKDSEAPKYVNSPETELFNKSEILFGYDKAKDGIRKFDFSLIVEGQFDVVLSHQAGYTNAVAVSGTALTVHHVSLLQRLSNKVVLALDADRAGIAAVKRAADIMLARGIDLKVARLPEGKDPADIAAKNPKELKNIIGHSLHVIEFLLAILKEEVKDKRKYKLRVHDEVLPYVLKIDNHIDRDHFIGVIAEAADTTKDAILLDVARLESKAEKTPLDLEKNINSQTEKAELVLREQNVVAFLITAKDIVPEKEGLVVSKLFKDIVGEDIETVRESISSQILSELVFRLEDQLNELTPLLRQTELLDRLNELATLVLKRQIKEAKEELILAESSQNEELMEKYIAEIGRLQQKLVNCNYALDIFA